MRKIKTSRGFQKASKQNKGTRRSQRSQRRNPEPTLKLATNQEDEDNTDFDKEELNFGHQEE